MQAAEGPFPFPTVRVRNRELFKTAIYQPLVKEILLGGYDAVIIGHELKFISNWIVAAICKARGIPVILWGFGYHAPRGIGYRRRASAAWTFTASWVKDWLARWADGFLAYTERGAERLRRLGLRCEVFEVRPSVNVAEQIPLHERYRREDQAKLRERLGLAVDSIVFLYIGRLVEAKNPHGLLDLVERLNADPNIGRRIEARIIGGGEDLESLVRRAEHMVGVEVLGEIYDQAVLAQYLAASDAVALPGAAGITVTHAFAHGTPVLMRSSPLHSPEADYVIHGENGLVSGESFEDLVAAATLFARSPTLRRHLAAGALRTRELFGFEHMADQFHRAVDSVILRYYGGRFARSGRRPPEARTAENRNH